MSRFLLVVTAAFGSFADAAVYKFEHSFKDRPATGASVIGLRTLHISGPTVVNVDEFSWLSSVNSASGRAAVVISRVGINVSKSIRCTLSPLGGRNPSLDISHKNVAMTSASPMGVVRSYKMAVNESGAHYVQIADCLGGLTQLSVTLSGPGLGAHEKSWAIRYVVIALLYAGLVVAARRIQKGATEAHDAVLFEVKMTSVLLLMMGCVGIVLHALPYKKNVLVTACFVSLQGGAIASLMTTFLSMSNAGSESPHKTRSVAWIFFFVCVMAALSTSARAYDNDVCDAFGCSSKGQIYSVLLPFIAGYGVLCVSCVVGLRRSIRYFQQGGVVAGVSFCQRLGAVVIIYVGLGTISALLQTYDVPSVEPRCWTMHSVTNIICLLTQFFGLAAIMTIISNGLPAPSNAGSPKKPYDQIDVETPSVIVVEQEDFQIDGESDDDLVKIENKTEKNSTTPVVMGSPE